MAANGKSERPIIIVRKKKKGGHEHHGGAWKVAYADFVTAMMAFFLVMWLVAAVSKDQRAAIFDYFKNPSMEQGKSTKPAPGQMGPGGASTSPIDLHGGLDAMRPALTKQKDVGGTAAPILSRNDRTEDGSSKIKSDDQEKAAGGEDKVTLQQASELQKTAERKQLEALMHELREAVDKSQALAPFKNQLLLDITPEGVRIQIVDAQSRPMFDVGSSRLRDYTTAILRELAPYLNSVPNRISLTGHTDMRPYPSSNGYTNWELSAERANAARRALTAGGLPDAKVSRVVGLSSSVLFDKKNPQNPINRRISIVVMTHQAEEDALKTDMASSPGTPAATEPHASANAPVASAGQAASGDTARPASLTATAVEPTQATGGAKSAATPPAAVADTTP